MKARARLVDSRACGTVRIEAGASASVSRSPVLGSRVRTRPPTASCCLDGAISASSAAPCIGVERERDVAARSVTRVGRVQGSARQRASRSSDPPRRPLNHSSSICSMPRTPRPSMFAKPSSGRRGRRRDRRVAARVDTDAGQPERFHPIGGGGLDPACDVGEAIVRGEPAGDVGQVELERLGEGAGGGRAVFDETRQRVDRRRLRRDRELSATAVEDRAARCGEALFGLDLSFVERSCARMRHGQMGGPSREQQHDRESGQADPDDPASGVVEGLGPHRAAASRPRPKCGGAAATAGGEMVSGPKALAFVLGSGSASESDGAVGRNPRCFASTASSTGSRP